RPVGARGGRGGAAPSPVSVLRRRPAGGGFREAGGGARTRHLPSHRRTNRRPRTEIRHPPAGGEDRKRTPANLTAGSIAAAGSGTPAVPAIFTLALHDALPIPTCRPSRRAGWCCALSRFRPSPPTGGWRIS